MSPGDQGVGPLPRRVIANLFFYYFGGATPSELAKSMDPSYTYSHVTFFSRNHQGDTVRRIIQRCREYIAKFPSKAVDFRLAGGLIGVTAAANLEIVKNDILTACSNRDPSSDVERASTLVSSGSVLQENSCV